MRFERSEIMPIFSSVPAAYVFDFAPALERARQGDGQLVLIVGEPGIGKSRLIEEFHGRLREVPHTWVEWNCSQLLQNTPLHLIAEMDHGVTIPPRWKREIVPTYEGPICDEERQEPTSAHT